MIRARLLGRFEIQANGKALALRLRQEQALLAYLLLNRGQPHRRERLSGLFWPEAGEANARSNLRHALWRIRKVFDESGEINRIETDDLTICLRLQASDWLDVSELEASVRPEHRLEDLARQVQVYGGELLPGFYDDWVQLERGRLTGLYERKLDELLEALLGQARWSEAAAWSEQWIAQGGAPEPAYRALMLARAAQGNLAAAGAAYRDCQEALERELGIEPSPQTQAVHEALRRGESPGQVMQKLHLLPGAQPAAGAVQPPPTFPARPAEFTPPVERTPTNLPAQLTSFVGREKEIDEIKWLVGNPLRSAGSQGTRGVPKAGGARLLTLTGPGGCGKTRLALQAAAGMLERFPDGVWLVELAALVDPALIPHTAASALGLQAEQGRPLTQSLAAYLRGKCLLLLVDNCEHLITGVAQWVEALLQACPGLQVLATSREALDIKGETPLQVEPLSTPALPKAGGPALQPQELEHYDAVRLFIDRAAALRPEFRLTAANAPALAQVCARLDGIPLAIELAAARIKAMTVEQIAARLDDRFRLLTGGSRTALPRQKTLRALVDWSYDLLAPDEQLLFNRLAVFAGGCSLEAAEAVCSDPEGEAEILPAYAILDTLARLVDKSLVLAEETGGETRYRMLETIRQYAREKLLEAGEAETFQDCHLDYFIAFARRTDAMLHGPDELAGVAQFELERDNGRAALDWATASPDTDGDSDSPAAGRVQQGLRLLIHMWQFWFVQGYWSEGYARAESLLSHPTAARRNLERAWGLMVAANLCDDLQAKNRYLEELIGLARELGEAAWPVLASGLIWWSWRNFRAEPERAEAFLEEAIPLVRAVNILPLSSALLDTQAWFCFWKGDLSGARQAWEDDLALCQEHGDRRMAVGTMRQLARIKFIQHDLVGAILQNEEALAFSRQTKARVSIAATLLNLSHIERANGRYELAKAYCQECCTILRDLGWPAEDLDELGHIALHEGDLPAARAVFARSLVTAQERHHRSDCIAALLGCGGLLAQEHNAEAAAVLLAFYQANSDEYMPTITDELDYERYLAAARSQLDEPTFQAACAKGRAMTLEQAIAYASKQLQLRADSC